MTANVPTAPSFGLRRLYKEIANTMDPRPEQGSVELRTAPAFPSRGSRAVTVLLLSPCRQGGGGRSRAWAQLSAMARQIKKALAYLQIVPAFLAMTASVAFADTLVLAAADTWPTAYLVDGRPTGMLVDLVTEAYRRAGHSVEVKLMPLGAVPQRRRDRGSGWRFLVVQAAGATNAFSPFRKRPWPYRSSRFSRVGIDSEL